MTSSPQHKYTKTDTITSNMEANPITMRANGFKVAGQQYKDMFYALRRIELMERDEERKAVEELRNELLRNHSQPWAGYNALCLMQYISESKATVLYDGLSNFAKESLWQYLEKLATKSKDTYSDYLTSKSKIEKRWGEWDTHEFLRRAPASGKGHIQALETFCMGVKADYAKAFINRQVFEHASKGVEAEDPTDRFEHQTKYMHAFFRLSKMPRKSDLLLKDSELEYVCGVIDSDGFLVHDAAKGNQGIQGKGDNHQTESTPSEPAPKNEETIEHQLPAGLNGTTAAAAEDAVKAEPTDEDQDIDLCEDAPIQVAGVQAIDNAHQNTNGTGSAEGRSTEATSPDSSESEEVQSDSSDQGQDDQSDNDHDGSNTNDGGDETPNDNGQASYHRQCLPCRYRHASCDKGQPICSQCIKHYGKDNRTHLCTYYYPSLTMPVVVPEEYKVRGIIRRRRKPNAGLSVNTNTDEATASTSRSGTTSAPPTTEPGAATSPGLNQQGNWKRWQRLQIIRLRGILMHCLERDAGIKIDIPNTEYDFFLASFATNNGFATVAPQEFLELFELKIWRWKRQIMSAIPLLIKDGIICFVKAGEQKNTKIPFFIRDYYLREAEKDKDGWEDIFGPKPLMEDMRQQQLLSQGTNAAAGMAKAEKTPNTTGKKRTRKPRKSVFDGIEGLDDERKRKNPRMGGSGAWQPSQTANSAPQEYDSDSDDNIIPPAFTASQPRPTAYSTTFRPPSASNNRPATAPSEPPLTRNLSQSHAPSAISTDGPTSVKDIIEGLKNDITDLQKLANSTNNALIKETARDECERLKMQCVEMKEWEAAEREVESNVSLSDAVRKMMKGALVRKALGRRNGG